MGGSAGGGGYDFQARVAAFVGAHILAKRPLHWLEDITDVPVAIEAETGRAGDDLRIELADSPVVIEVQVKRGINGEAKVTQALEGFVRDMVGVPTEHAVLLVDPRTPVAVASNLPTDLRRLRQGRTDVGPLATAVRSYLAANEAESLASRLYVVQLGLQDRHAGHQQAAIAWLTAVVGDEVAAEDAWAALVADGWTLVAERGRRDRTLLERCLAEARVPVTGHGRAAVPGEAGEMLTLLRGIAAAQGVFTAPTEPRAAGPRVAADEAWHAQIDAARDLITAHQPAAAVRVLAAIEARVDAAPAAGEGAIHDVRAVRRRLHGNRASALVRLGDLDRAQHEAAAALTFGPDDAAILAIAGRVAVLRDERAEAARLARQLLAAAPDNTSAWSMLVELGEATMPLPVPPPPTAAAGQRGWASGPSAVGAPAVPDALQLDPTVLLSAGLRALNAGQPSDAERYLRAALDMGSRGPEPLSLLALALTATHRAGPGGVELPFTSIAAAAEAEALLTEALAGFESADYSVMLEQMLLARGSARRMLHRPQEALDDARRALARSPPSSEDRWRPACLTAALLLDLGQTEAAAHVVAEFAPARSADRAPASDDGQPPALGPVPLPTEAVIPFEVLRARITTALGEPDAVKRHLEAAMQAAAAGDPAERESARGQAEDAARPRAREAGDDRAESAWLRTAVIAVECGIEAGLVDFATEVHATLPAERVGWVHSLLTARLALAHGEPARAWPAFDAAVVGAEEDADTDAARRVRLEHAAARARARAFVEAVALYERADAWSFTAARPGYVAALIEAGRSADARERLDELEREGPLPTWALAAAAAIAEARDDLEAAVHYLEELWRQRPENTSTGLRLATAYGRLDRASDAVTTLSQLTGRADLSGRERMLVADRLFAAGQHDEALEQAFRALRLAGDDAEIAKAFVNIAVRHEQTGAKYAPKRVGPDTHVRLVPTRRHGGAGEPVTYTILREGPVEARRNEFLVGDARVAPLLWRKEGDVVTFRRGQPTEAVYRIGEIQSAVVAAFQEVIRTFPERFPEAQGLQRFHVDDALSPETLLPIVAALHQHAAFTEQALTIYAETPLPIGALATGMRRPTAEVCELLASSGPWLYTEFGDEPGQARALRAASDGPIVLTRTALWTAMQLGLWGTPVLEPLAGLGRALWAPRSLMEELEAEVVEAARSRGQGRRFLAAAPTGVAVHERSAEQEEVYSSALDELVGWVRREAIVLPRPHPALTIDGQERRELVGESAADALELARERQGSVFADDLVLRQLEVRGAPAEGFSTWALVQVLLNEGLLTAEQARRTIVGLIRLRHHFVSVNGEFLFGVLRDSAYTIDARVSLVLDRLAGTDVDIESAAAATADLLRHLALDPIGAGALAPTTQACVERISRGRRVVPTLRVLDHALVARLELLPHALTTVRSVMQRFLQAKRRARALT